MLVHVYLSVYLTFSASTPAVSDLDERTTTDVGATGGESSTIPSSEWSRKRREMYDAFTPEEQALFDELQQEIDFLKNLLAKRDKRGAEKVRQA